MVYIPFLVLGERKVPFVRNGVLSSSELSVGSVLTDVTVTKGVAVARVGFRSFGLVVSTSISVIFSRLGKDSSEK